MAEPWFDAADNATLASTAETCAGDPNSFNDMVTLSGCWARATPMRGNLVVPFGMGLRTQLTNVFFANLALNNADYQWDNDFRDASFIALPLAPAGSAAQAASPAAAPG